MVRAATVVAPAVALCVTWAFTVTAGSTPALAADVRLYFAYAGNMAGGLLPYRDFLFEYPPLALAPIITAAAVSDGFAGFQLAFELLMLGAALVVQRQVARTAGANAATVAWVLAALPLATGAIAAERLDLVAVALLTAGLAALLGAEPSPLRSAAGLGLLGLGTAVKLFPAVVAVVAVAWLWGRGSRRSAVVGAATFVATVLVVCVPVLVVAPRGLLESLAFQVRRPLQIESTGATVARLFEGAVVTGVDERPNPWRSQAVEGGVSNLAGAVLSAVQLVAILLAAHIAATTRRDDRRPCTLIVPATAALIAFVVLGKVLSPQYLLWLAPLAPLLWWCGERVAAALVVLAVVLTRVEFPGLYTPVVAGDPGALALLAGRNVALLVALGILLFHAAGPVRGPGEARSSRATRGRCGPDAERAWPPRSRA